MRTGTVVAQGDSLTIDLLLAREPTSGPGATELTQAEVWLLREGDRTAVDWSLSAYPTLAEYRSAVRSKGLRLDLHAVSRPQHVEVFRVARCAAVVVRVSVEPLMLREGTYTVVAFYDFPITGSGADACTLHTSLDLSVKTRLADGELASQLRAEYGAAIEQGDRAAAGVIARKLAFIMDDSLWHGICAKHDAERGDVDAARTELRVAIDRRYGELAGGGSSPETDERLQSMMRQLEQLAESR